MSHRRYDKLVRDRIPEILTSKGIEFLVRRLPDREFQVALLNKLVEESMEMRALAPKDHDKIDRTQLTEELADLFEVVDAILKSFGIEHSEVRKVQEEKLIARGGFQERHELAWTLEPRPSV